MTDLEKLAQIREEFGVLDSVYYKLDNLEAPSEDIEEILEKLSTAIDTRRRIIQMMENDMMITHPDEFSNLNSKHPDNLN